MILLIHKYDRLIIKFKSFALLGYRNMGPPMAERELVAPETSKPEAITAIQIPDGQCLFSFPAAVIKNSNQSNLREVGSTLPSLREVEAGTMEERYLLAHSLGP